MYNMSTQSVDERNINFTYLPLSSLLLLLLVSMKRARGGAVNPKLLCPLLYVNALVQTCCFCKVL